MVLVVPATSVSADVVFTGAIVVAVAIVGFWLWALVEALSWPRSTWDAAGLSKGRWVFRLFLMGALSALVLGGVGALMYVRGPRPELKAAYGSDRWGDGVAGGHPAPRR